ncbi:developmentally-regulated protein with signal peptide [Acrasis kona]|uniref:Developmentally-regulated protein with signal peptide n=1 Tax=Acrasis kona TaxID=1008807 RepID=A0AAW2ZAZ5_9EUKA
MNKLPIILIIALFYSIFAEELTIPIHKDTGYYWISSKRPSEVPPPNYGVHQQPDNYTVVYQVHVEVAYLLSSYDLSQLQGKQIIKAEFDVSKLLYSTNYAQTFPDAEYHFPINQINDYPVELVDTANQYLTKNERIGFVRVKCSTLESVQALDVTQVVKGLLSNNEDKLHLLINGAKIHQPIEGGFDEGIGAPSGFKFASKQRNPYSTFLKVQVSDSSSEPEVTTTQAPATTKAPAQNESGENMAKEEQANSAASVVAGAVGVAAVAAAIL